MMTFGLVKSGNMALLESWNLDGYYSGHRSTVVNWHGFSVDAIAPVVFTHGQGVFHTTKRVGNTHTFYFAAASTSTEFFVFDLVRDVGAGGLRTWNESGVCTFNSIQVPMNVVATSVPPSTPGGSGENGTGETAYNGGENIRSGQNTVSRWWYALTSGRKYAAFIPWNRGGRCFDGYWPAPGGSIIGAAYSVIEGAYGEWGGVRHAFALDPLSYMNSTPNYTPISFDSIARSRQPSISVVDVTNIPVPFDL